MDTLFNIQNERNATMIAESNARREIQESLPRDNYVQKKESSCDCVTVFVNV